MHPEVRMHFLVGAFRCGNNPPVLLGKKIAEQQKCLPCVKGGGFCEAKDGGIVIVETLKTTPQSALLTGPLAQGSLMQLPVHGL